MEIVKYLMPIFGDSKFDLDSSAHNCLHSAVWEGHLKVVQYLIEEEGFDPSLKDGVSKHVYYDASLVTSLISHTFICVIYAG